MNEDYSKTSRIMVYVVIFFVVVALALLVFFLAIPRTKLVYSAKDSLKEAELNLEQMKKYATRAEEFNRLKESIEKDYPMLEKSLLNEDTMVSFIEEIEAISDNLGTELEISQYKSAKKKATGATLKLPGQEDKATQDAAPAQTPQQSTIQLKLASKSNYKQFLRFLYRLENMPYVFNVEGVRVLSASGGRLVKEGTPVDLTSSEILISFIKN